MKEFEIRADYNGETIIVYQAYNNEIAKSGVENQKFCALSDYKVKIDLKSILWKLK